MRGKENEGSKISLIICSMPFYCFLIRYLEHRFVFRKHFIRDLHNLLSIVRYNLVVAVNFCAIPVKPINTFYIASHCIFYQSVVASFQFLVVYENTYKHISNQFMMHSG